MGFTEEERQRNLRASQEQLEEDIEAFLRRYAGFEAGFSADELAVFVRSDRIDRRAAHQILMALKDKGRVHYLAGRWHVGPLRSVS
jgi:hypothetical protein